MYQGRTAKRAATRTLRTLTLWILVGSLGVGAGRASGAWPATGGGAGFDDTRAVVTAPSGNVYAAGRFSWAAVFGVESLTAAGGEDGFVASYDAAGNLRWLRPFGGTRNDLAVALAVDPATEDVYVTGVIRDTVSFGSTTLSVGDTNHVFVARLDRDGHWLWAVSGQGGGSSLVNDVALLGADNTAIPPRPAQIFVAGVYATQLSFANADPETFPEPSLPAAGSQADFVARLNADGHWIWAMSLGLSRNTNLVADESGRVLVGGEGGSGSGAVLTRLSGALTQAPAVAWTRDLPAGLTVLDLEPSHADGRAYLAGLAGSPVDFGGGVSVPAWGLVARFEYDGPEPVWRWAESFGDGSVASGAAEDEGGNVYVVGSFGASVDVLTVGGDTLVSAGSTDVFVAGLAGSNGQPQWAERAGGASPDVGLAIASTGTGNLYIAGGFGGAATFGEETVTSRGDRDAYVASLQAQEPRHQWFRTEDWIVGQAIPPPPGADVDSVIDRPDIDGVEPAEDFFLWVPPSAQQAAGRLYPLQPAGATLRWRVQGEPLESEARITRAGRARWPETDCTATVTGPCRQVHVAGAPVNVEPPGGSLLFRAVHLPVAANDPSDAAVETAALGQTFEATRPGFSVVRYAQGQVDGPAVFEVVETVGVIDPRAHFRDAVACTVGEEITDDFHDDLPGRNGYVLRRLAFYDPASYDRDTRQGRIFPVNRLQSWTGPVHEMSVAWYRTNDKGVAWGERSVRYECRWPLDPDRIVIASEQGSEVLGQELLDPRTLRQMQIYNQGDDDAPGFNPNDEHAIFAPSGLGSGLQAVFALRAGFQDELLDEQAASLPYVLLRYVDAATGRPAFKVYQVFATGAGFDDFRFHGVAGSRIHPPYPLTLLTACAETEVRPPASGVDPFFPDVSENLWARSAGRGEVLYYHPLQPTFFLDLDNDRRPDDDWSPEDPLRGDGVADAEQSRCVPWLPRVHAPLDEPIPVAYEIVWPPDVPLLTLGETLLTAKRGLPDIKNQAAAEIVFDELDPEVENADLSLAQLLDVLSPRTVVLRDLSAAVDAFTGVRPEVDLTDGVATALDPATGRRTLLGNADGTVRLPYAVRSRVSYDPIRRTLSFQGLFDESGAGEPLLLLNVMSETERALLRELSADEDYRWALDRLYVLSRNPQRVDTNGDGVIDEQDLAAAGGSLVGLQDRCFGNTCRSDNETEGRTFQLGSEAGDEVLGFAGDGVREPLRVLGVMPALTAGSAQGTGYVTLAFNNDRSLVPLPVSLEVIRVGCLRFPEPPEPAQIESTYQGQLQIIESDNVFDEQLTLSHSGDFGASPEDFQFQWFSHPDLDGTPPTPLPDPDGGQLNGWLQFPGDGASISIEGPNLRTLSDNWFVARYRRRGGSPLCGGGWSLFAGQPGGTPLDPRAQLAEGWIKRVVDGLDPFEARVRDFHAAATNTFASMLVQLGERYEGDIAFNPSASNLNSLGLIEGYETVLRRGIDLSIGATPPLDFGPANAALLNVASRISDFYMLLGNEAYADATDPTVGITTQSFEFGFGSLAPTIFNFQNQVASLLEEELVLLRGRDDSQGPVAASPVYNRLFWNFTNGRGEVAYALSYNITDQDRDGIVDETDARTLFPQGHGDAWGHYLTALTTYYRLLRHPSFTWEPRPEAVIVAGTPIQVDFLDERQFAKTAAAKARAGADLVDLTYRLAYVEDPAGQWQGYKDTDPDRAWGLSGWARRAGQGAYFDWVTVNAILPDEDPDPEHAGIQRIERGSIGELAQIAAAYDSVQTQLDEADRGLNPLGLAKGVVPFDVDPARIDAGETHFEQVFDRAKTALDNTVRVWDFANQLTRMLRFNQDSAEDLRDNSRSREFDFTSRLLEIFGYPYSDDIGPGGTYPAGYEGPDLFHFMSVDTSSLAGLSDIQLRQEGCVDGAGDPIPPPCFKKIERFKALYSALPGGVNFFNLTQQEGDDPEIGLDCGSNPFGRGCRLGDPPNRLEEQLEVEYVTLEDPAVGFTFLKDPEWTGRRRAIGKLQDALLEVIQAQISFRRAIVEYDRLIGDIECAVDTMEATFNVRDEQLRVRNAARGETNDLNAVITAFKSASIALKRTAKTIETKTKDGADCVPDDKKVTKIGGGGDVFAQLKCGLKKVGAVAQLVLEISADVADSSVDVTEAAKEDIALQAAIDLQIQDDRLELFVAKGNIGAMIRREPVQRVELYARREALEQAQQKFLTVLAEGQRLLRELTLFRKDTAGAVQPYRYQDLAFRIFRNDALQKYRAQFDLAARYTYLAAAAYDYETNLLGTDAQGGRRFLTDIVRQRGVGQLLDGEPVPGSPGLADPMARMMANFQVLKGQMGFNNPQSEGNRFSLRRELFRIQDGDGSDEAWRQVLAEHRVTDLWDVPEFRRFARPFAPESLGPQPGIVIPMSTTVTFGLNFFGWPLGPGDSAYDPTHFATRIRAAGVWLAGYDELPLSGTPRVYLIPVGADVLRSPASGDFATREWSVVDQVLPVPFAIGGDDLQKETWSPLADTLSGSFDEVRRFGSFRAFDAGRPLSDAELNFDSRLIGRSVWNTRWLLIIPGGTLLFDPEEGLDAFVDGVDDVSIFFKSYAYSGN